MYDLKSADELLALVNERGFLPFFRCGIEGFSLEEMTRSEDWFKEGVIGPWEWKNDLARSRECVYGRIFGGKMGFLSLDWLPDLANCRRDGYDFEGYYEDGHASRAEKEIVELLEKRGSLLTREIKRALGFGKERKGYETAITRLQMRAFVLPRAYEQARDRQGREYGWHIARFDLAERYFGEAALAPASGRTPVESLKRMLARCEELLPGVPREQWMKLLYYPI